MCNNFDGLLSVCLLILSWRSFFTESERAILLDGRQKESLKVETEWTTGQNKEIKA